MLAPVNWESDWGPLWWDWYNTKGAEGEEPPDEVKEACDIFDQIKTTTNVEDQFELARKAVLMRAQNVWQIWTGPVWLPRCSFVVVKNNMNNVPPEFPYNWWYPSPAPTQTYLYYFDPPQEM
jgi:peptide/nickel transport system substrate-binding protein